MWVPIGICPVFYIGMPTEVDMDPDSVSVLGGSGGGSDWAVSGWMIVPPHSGILESERSLWDTNTTEYWSGHVYGGSFVHREWRECSWW